MGDLIDFARRGTKLIRAVDLVHSPDDGGYYFSEANFVRKKNRVSRGVFVTREAALKAWNDGKVKWEAWH